jgi:hypothetical protein
MNSTLKQKRKEEEKRFAKTWDKIIPPLVKNNKLIMKSEIFGMIKFAAKKFRLNGDKNSSLILFTDLQQVGDGYDFERYLPPLKTVVAKLKNYNLIPNLSGIKVYVFGVTPTHNVGSLYYSKLLRWWKLFFKKKAMAKQVIITSSRDVNYIFNNIGRKVVNHILPEQTGRPEPSPLKPSPSTIRRGEKTSSHPVSSSYTPSQISSYKPPKPVYHINHVRIAFNTFRSNLESAKAELISFTSEHVSGESGVSFVILSHVYSFASNISANSIEMFEVEFTAAVPQSISVPQVKIVSRISGRGFVAENISHINLSSSGVYKIAIPVKIPEYFRTGSYYFNAEAEVPGISLTSNNVYFRVE